MVDASNHITRMKKKRIHKISIYGVIIALWYCRKAFLVTTQQIFVSESIIICTDLVKEVALGKIVSASGY